MNEPIDQLDLIDWCNRSARRSDPETSRLAAERAGRGRRHGWGLVLQHLAAGAKTDFELADATGIAQTSIGKRRGECRDEGWVEAATDAVGMKITRPAPIGSPSIVWRLTALGREVSGSYRVAA